jgi:hypothetical protein
MIRKELDAEPQLVRPSLEAPKAIDQREPVAPYLTRRGSRSLRGNPITPRDSIGNCQIHSCRLSV